LALLIPLPRRIRKDVSHVPATVDAEGASRWTVTGRCPDHRRLADRWFTTYW